MNRNKRRLALHGQSFLDSAVTEPSGLLELGSESARQLLAWRPDALAQIFRSDRFMRMEGSGTLGPLVGDRSVLFANGTRHSKYRQVLGSPMRGRQLSAYHSLIADTTHAAIDTLHDASTVMLPEWSRELALRIIGQIVLGGTSDELLTRYTTWVDDALGTPRRALAYRYLRLPHAIPSPWRTFLTRREGLRRDLLQQAVRGARESSCPTLTGQLINGTAPLGTVSEPDLVDQVMSLLFAGHETSASAIAWTLFWLEQNEQLNRDVRDELAATSSDGSSAEAVPLLDAVCREALRLSPPATVAGNRILVKDQELFGQPLTQGTRVTPCIYLAHRQPDIYPEPLRFNPNRFLNKRWSVHEYLPFGGGVRRCLGADLAMLELRMIVAAVLRRVELHCLNPETGVPQQRGPAMGPKRTLTMSVRTRRS